MASVNNSMNADTLSIDVLDTYITSIAQIYFLIFLSRILHLLYLSLEGVGDKWEA